MGDSWSAGGGNPTGSPIEPNLEPIIRPILWQYSWQNGNISSTVLLPQNVIQQSCFKWSRVFFQREIRWRSQTAHQLAVMSLPFILRGKIVQICSGLDSTITAKSEDVSSVPCLGQILMDEFQLLRPEDVDMVLESVHSTTTLLDPCPSWLIGRSAGGVAPVSRRP